MSAEDTSVPSYRTAANDYPVIGFLTESLSSIYQSSCWIGASDEAVKRGYSLVCYAGGSLNKSSWDPYEPQRNAIYNFVDVNRLKGLIITGSIGNFISPLDFESFYNRFNSIPMVCLGPGMQSVTSILVDNYHGIHELISHLIELHGCSRIAFVRGPEGNQEAEQRLEIFRKVLLEHGITPDNNLIIPGDFSRDSGARAVYHLIDKYGLSFDALVGANDDIALGALKAFQERHIRVPDEVLVVGFDDIEESGFSAPPLTTVRQPFYEMGAKAIEVLLDSIKGIELPSIITVPATVTTRQSCGCFRLDNTTDIRFDIPSHLISDMQRKLFYEEIAAIMEQSRMSVTGVINPELIQQFSDSFFDEITEVNPGGFIPVINKVAWMLALAGGDTPGLLKSINVMRQLAIAFYGGEIPAKTEELFQSATLAIADAAARAQAHRRLNADRQASLLRNAGQAIASAFDFEKLLSVINSELVKLTINEFWVSLYTVYEPTIKYLKLHSGMSNGNYLNLNEIAVDFKAPALAPDEVMAMDKPRSLLIEPLFFKEDQIGIIVFNVERCRDGLTYEILRQHISSSLKGALLMKKVQEQALALELANIQLQKLRDAEHAYLEAVKHELELGREIQSSFLPREIPQVSGWEICPAFQPAREVSGDFYDVFTLPDGKVVLVLSDVSGKDVSAALFMGMIRTLIRALSEQAVSDGSDPLDAVKLTNKYLINHHYGNNGRYMYATLFMAVLDPVQSTFTYVNAGHNPPAIVLATGGVRKWIDTTGPAVGIIPDGQFNCNQLDIASGELLFIYTDGVTEARSPDGELFTKKRLSSILDNSPVSASATVSQVEYAVRQHCEGKAQSDDITILAVYRSKIE